MNRDGRYAPSPTGALHLGNLRTALGAWLLARSAGASFSLRIEDLDPDRSRPEHARRQLDDLAALGLDWDQQLPPQSTRQRRYEEAVELLAARGLLYECYCTRTEIREAASAPHGELPEGAYPGTCRDLVERERAARRAEGRPAALRVRAGGARVEFEDRLQGLCRGTVDDFVVRRNDGVHGYLLATTVDDCEQGIGEVVRGRDLLDSVPRQVWIADKLDLPAIESWAHLPLVLGPDGERLAKRHGAVTLADRQALGESSAQTVGLLAASLGLCEPGAPASPAELLAGFDPGALPRADAPLEAGWE